MSVTTISKTDSRKMWIPVGVLALGAAWLIYLLSTPTENLATTATAEPAETSLNCGRCDDSAGNTRTCHKSGTYAGKWKCHASGAHFSCASACQ